MFFLYLSVFFSLGLFVSARTTRSSTSFLVLLFVWVVFVMVIPRSRSSQPGRSGHPLGPRGHSQKDAFLQQIQAEGQKGFGDWAQKNQELAKTDVKAYQEKLASSSRTTNRS